MCRAYHKLGKSRVVATVGRWISAEWRLTRVGPGVAVGIASLGT